MVDRLKRSVEGLEPPACPACHMDMRWYRSELAKDGAAPAVLHFFVCPSCNRIAQTRTAAPDDAAPPKPRLSRPARPADAA
jgi:hypothetical protein